MRSIDIAQPDLNHCGGLLEAKNISAAAAVANIGIAPHNPNGPIAGAADSSFLCLNSKSYYTRGNG